MSNRIEVSAVEAQFEELAEQFGVQVEDLTLTIEDGPMTTSIAGEDLAITEGDDESDDTSEAGDGETENVSEADEDTIEDGEVRCEECGTVYDSEQGFYGHLSGDCSGNIEDVEEETEDQSETEDTSEAGGHEVMSEAELREAGVDPENIEDVQEYQERNGICDAEDCPYGANDDSDYCASHSNQSNSSSSESSSETTNADQVQQVEDLFGVDRITAEAVVFRVSEGDFDSHSEAVEALDE